MDPAIEMAVASIEPEQFKLISDCLTFIAVCLAMIILYIGFRLIFKFFSWFF
jgi:hypothetical protein